MKYGVQAKIEDFDKQNGGASIVFNEWVYYANGANRDIWPHGALIDPPKDDYKRLSNIVCYHQGRLNQAVSDFDNFKEQLMMSGHPDASRLDQLRSLQAVVGERNAALVEAKRQLGETAEAQRRECYRQTEAESQARTAEFRKTVSDLRV